jgi:hypothetical protein
VAAVLGVTSGVRLRDIDFTPVDTVSADAPSPATSILSPDRRAPPEPVISAAPADSYNIAVTLNDTNIDSSTGVSTELMDMGICASAAIATVLDCDPPITGCTNQ